MSFQIKLANLVFQIDNLFSNIEIMCADYFCAAPTADICIHIDPEDIEKEILIVAKNNPNDSIDKSPERLGYLETLAVYRKIAESILVRNTFLMHGAVIGNDTRAFMICAPSGVGKTTRSQLFMQCLQGYRIINGDKPLLNISNNQILACGTPWCGKEGYQSNECKPLKAILLLERSEQNCLTQLSASEAFPSLLKQTYRPNNIVAYQKTLDLLQQVTKSVSLFKMESSPDESGIRQICDVLKTFDLI